MLVLETKELTVEFSGFKAISNLNFSLNPGELRVILGPNGAGKTTLMDLITGKTKPTKGKVIFKGKDITSLNSAEISRLGLGRKFQGPNIFNNMTVTENIEIALKGASNLFSALFFKKTPKMQSTIDKILEEIGLKDRRHEMAAILSHGQKQWLELGMLLAQDPQLIILDEPTTGMTSEETYKTGEMIETIFKGRSVIVVEHDMAFVRQIAKVVTVLHQGQFLAQGTLQEIEANKQVQDVYLKEPAHA